jgi:hypothetical protein
LQFHVMFTCVRYTILDVCERQIDSIECKIVMVNAMRNEFWVVASSLWHSREFDCLIISYYNKYMFNETKHNMNIIHGLFVNNSSWERFSDWFSDRFFLKETFSIYSVFQNEPLRTMFF